MNFSNILTFILPLFTTVLGWADRGKPVVSGYYPSYKAHIQPPSKIPWSHYSHIDYFVVPVKDSGDQLPVDNEANLRETVSLARAHNVSISITLGGWTGSGFFSPITSNKDSRDKFASAIVALIKKFEVDGAEIDWEYPATPGHEGNIYTPADTQNFLALLTTLREQLGKDYRLSAAVPMQGFKGADGQHLSDTRAFSEVLDYITIMAYDAYISGPGNLVAGPNAPLHHTCSGHQSRASVAGAIEGWLKSGFSADKILLGLPAYGYGYTLVADSLEPTQLSGSPNSTSLLYQPALPTARGGKSGLGGGQWLYRELQEEGLLSKDSTQGLSGYQRHYDKCTHTPFLYQPQTKHMIVYDDAGSILEKSVYAKEHQLAGVNFFDTTGDALESQLARAAAIIYPVHHSEGKKGDSLNPRSLQKRRMDYGKRN